MNCQEAELLFIDHLDNTLSSQVSGELSQHIHNCASCSAQFAQLTATYRLIEQEKEMPVNPFFYTRVKARLEAEAQPKQLVTRLTQVLKPLAVAASIFIGLYIGSGEIAMLALEQDETEVGEEFLLPADYDEMLLTFVE